MVYQKLDRNFLHCYILFQPITATILGAYFFSEILLLQLIGVIILIGIYFAGLSERLREINEK